jgi:3D (Asp-Asp-Asp) domain-containing protein
LRAVAACFSLLAIAGFLSIAGASGARGPSLGALKAHDANLAAQARSAVLELYSLDTRLTAAQARLAALQADARTLHGQRASVERQMRLARLDAHLSQDRLASHLRFIYEHGSTSSLEVVMGAKSISDAMTQLDDFNRVAAANASVLDQLRSAKQRLTRLGRQLAIEQHDLAATLAAASATVSELSRVKGERQAYVAGLAQKRSLDAVRIAQLTAQARAADAKSQTLVPGPAPRAAVSIAPSVTLTANATSGRTLTVVATAYDLKGHTSTGLPVGWGIAAVDPAVIPLGTHIVIPGYGAAVAADTGPSIVGSTIDLWFPSPAQAYAWGRRTITVTLS